MQVRRRTAFRVLFNSISSLILLTFLFNSPFVQNWVYRASISQENPSVSSNFTSEISGLIKNGERGLTDSQICDKFFTHEGYLSPCEYIKAHPDCNSGGYLNYTKFLFCDCKNHLFFGYFILSCWLIILFYLLGNTASDYFCCSLEKLSKLLKMSPTIAGVTLLPLGNGAPDVFASIAAFVGRSSGDVGINGVLGAAVFVTCVVVGVVAICVAEKKVQIDKKCFIRDICFFLFAIGCLALILVVGEVNIWVAICFVSIYVVYALFVGFSEVVKNKGPMLKLDGLKPLLPVVGTLFGNRGQEKDGSMNAPLLHNENSENPPQISSKLPHLVWNSNFSIYSDGSSPPLWGWTEKNAEKEVGSSFSFTNLFSFLEIPMVVPRRLTIPIVEEDRWSKFYAVASATLSPMVLAFLWNTRDNVSPLSGRVAYFVCLSIGLTLGFLAMIYTSSDHPPRKLLLPWVIGGFMMSIIWFYLIANELVALLISIGMIFRINPSILALTILAWGNSMGDLTANTALAMNQRDGVQIAISGSYAGPMFNTLIGLGVSLLIGASSMGSDPYVIPKDGSLFVTMGFLVAGLIWALIVLPIIDMKPNKFLGVGLITIYLMFLGLRLGSAMGLGSWP